ncbi:unnamed protein product [Lupinus luteus]|uniref:DUF4283 domain-containing protein n=1 Tax=Lupinus luteus TaxID=3873 RepID=A0AAV1XKV6_LUPLU
MEAIKGKALLEQKQPQEERFLRAIALSQPTSGTGATLLRWLKLEVLKLEILNGNPLTTFGILSNQVDCTTLKEKLHLDGFFSIHVFSLGGRSVLLRAEEEGQLESLLRDEKDWFNTRFSSIRKWKPTDLAQDRFLWIRCDGFPLHAWEEDLFMKIGSLFGKFSGLDDGTRYKRNLEC